MFRTRVIKRTLKNHEIDQVNNNGNNRRSGNNNNSNDRFQFRKNRDNKNNNNHFIRGRGRGKGQNKLKQSNIYEGGDQLVNGNDNEFNCPNSITAVSGTDVVVDYYTNNNNNHNNNYINRLQNCTKSVFAKFRPIDDVIDLVGQKRLLELIVKIQVLFFNVNKAVRHKLEQSIFNMAFIKLPEEKREQYNHFCDRGVREASLVDLRKYLQDEIILYSRLLNSGQLFDKDYVVEEYNTNNNIITVDTNLSYYDEEEEFEENWGKIEDLTTTTASTPGTDTNIPGIIRCWYCKGIGHSRFHCLEREAILCLRCFHYGHTKNHCRNDLKCYKLRNLINEYNIDEVNDDDDGDDDNVLLIT